MNIRKFHLLIVFLLLCITPAAAQRTTSDINGTITDKNGEAIPSAVVIATHVPSGTIYYAVTNGEGHYTIDGMRPGGPYVVEFSCMGYDTVNVVNVVLELANSFALNTVLYDSELLLEEAVITEEYSHFSSEKAGSISNITSKDIENFPTDSRTIIDLTRLSAYGGNDLNIAGGNGKVINFTVDGANINNNLGLGNQLTGGGNPISIEALAEVQLVVSPFDVRQNNFVVAGINAVSKSGTNKLIGTAYHSVNNALKNVIGITVGGPIIHNKLFYFVNLEYEKTPPQEYKWKASFNGISSYDANLSRTTISDLNEVSEFVKSEYKYDPGSYTNYPAKTGNYKLLSRIDWNINSTNKLSFRFNTTFDDSWKLTNGNSVDGGAIMTKGRISEASMVFSNSLYLMHNDVTTLSLNYNSRFSDYFYFDFLATYSSINHKRHSNSEEFPFIDILEMDDNDMPQSYMSLGYEPFSWNNSSKNKVFTAKSDIVFYGGNHKVTAGLNLESQYMGNSYMRNGTGYYRYKSVSDFINGNAPEIVSLTYGFDPSSTPIANIKFNNYGAYLQDEWDVTKDFKLTYGIRYDLLAYDSKDLGINLNIWNIDYSGEDLFIDADNPEYPDELESRAKRIDISNWPENHGSFSPRFGFSWDVFGNKSLKFRGGAGIFTGRIPIVLLLNMPANGGLIQYQSVLNGTGANGGKMINMDSFAGGLITDSSGKPSIKALREFIIANGYGPKNYYEITDILPSSISAIDPNFKMPQTLKVSLGLDYKVPVSFPLTLTLEGTFNKVIQDVVITDWAIKPFEIFDTFTGVDNRPIYDKNHKYIHHTNEDDIVTLPSAFMVSNTNKGYGYIGTFTVKSTPAKGLDLKFAYTYTASYELTGIPDDKLNAMVPYIPSYQGFNNTVLHPSPTIIPNRFLLSASYKNDNGSLISFVYEILQGNNKYSYMFENDMNGDGYNYDLIYIPKNKNELQFISDDDRDRFWDFVNRDKYLSSHKGEYASAYSVYIPFMHKVDLRFSQDFKFKVGENTNNIQFTINISNLLNLLDPKSGVGKEMNPVLNKGRILKYEGVDENKTPIFSTPAGINSDINTWVYRTSNTQYWRIQLGLKYFFN